MYYFTSDTQFGDSNSLKRENRPFANNKEFKEFIFNTWNKQAKSKDIIYHLGDYINFNEASKPNWKSNLKTVQKINAKVILIIGNSEQRLIDSQFNGNFEAFRAFCKKQGFYEVKTEEYLTFKNKKFYLNHFPRNYKKDYINLFGHTHRTTGLWKPFGLNMSCDLNHFFLFSEKEIERLLYLKTTYWDNDIDNLTF